MILPRSKGKGRFNRFLKLMATIVVENTVPQKRFIDSRCRLYFGRLLSLAMLIVVCGCQQRTVGTLLGRWEGQPDTAAARAEREKLKYGEVQEVKPEAGTAESARITDWEQYDVSVSFDFKSADRVEMSLADNDDPQAGSWRIVASTPTGCTIEIKTDPSAEQAEGESQAENAPRRFELELDQREGECVGFLLTEVGADHQLGSLYFSRPEQAQ